MAAGVNIKAIINAMGVNTNLFFSTFVIALFDLLPMPRVVHLRLRALAYSERAPTNWRKKFSKPGSGEKPHTRSNIKGNWQEARAKEAAEQ
jgi:hypothetical protein